MIYVIIPFIIAFYGWFRSQSKRDEMGRDLFGAQINRLSCWGVPVCLLSILFYKLEFNLFVFVLLSAAYWFGLAIKGWGEWYNLTTWQDAFHLTWRGLLRTVFAGLVIAYFTDWQAGYLLALSGISMPLGYYLGKIIKSDIIHLKSGPELGETITCLFIGLAMMLDAILMN